MPAIAKLTPSQITHHITECFTKANAYIIQHAKLAHAGCVDNHGSARQHNKLRWVVVWRPFESSSRISPTAIISCPARALTRLDLPTPDEPRKTTVCRALSNLSAHPAQNRLLCLLHVLRLPEQPFAMPNLFRTILYQVGFCQYNHGYRSGLPRQSNIAFHTPELKSWLSDCMTNT